MICNVNWKVFVHFCATQIWNLEQMRSGNFKFKLKWKRKFSSFYFRSMTTASARNRSTKCLDRLSMWCNFWSWIIRAFFSLAFCFSSLISVGFFVHIRVVSRAWHFRKLNSKLWMFCDSTKNWLLAVLISDSELASNNRFYEHFINFLTIQAQRLWLIFFFVNLKLCCAFINISSYVRDRLQRCLRFLNFHQSKHDPIRE